MILRQIRPSLDPLLLEMVRGAGLVFILKMSGVGITFVTGILIARLLGTGGFGVFSLAMTCTTIIAVVARLGIDNAVVRTTSSYLARGDDGAAAGTYKAAIRLTVPVSAVASVVVFVLAPTISTGLFDEPALMEPLRIAAIVLVPTTVMVTTTESLRALKHPGQATFFQTVLPFLVILAVLLVLPVFIAAPAPSTIVSVHVAGVGVTAFLAWLAWQKHTRDRAVPRRRVPVSPLLSQAVPLLSIMLVSLTITSVDIFMLGIWVDAENVGLYSAAARISNLMILLLTAINTVAGPKFSELHTQGRMPQLSHLARSCALVSTILVLPVYVLFVAFPGTIMGLFGPGFEASSVLLVILATGQLVNVATGSVGVMLIMTGHEHSMRSATVAAGVLNIVLNAMLIPFWGTVGAATATAISVTTLNIACLVLVYRKLSIRMVSFLP